MQHALEIEPHFAAIAPARRWAHDLLTEAGVEGETLNVMVLLVSEVVTNAVAHAVPPVSLIIHINEERARVEVRDCARELPILKRPPPTQPGGRGVALVDMLATRWGVGYDELDGQLKSVWFELAL